MLFGKPQPSFRNDHLDLMPEANDPTRETRVLVFNYHNFGELDLPTFCNSSRAIQVFDPSTDSLGPTLMVMILYF